MSQRHAHKANPNEARSFVAKTPSRSRWGFDYYVSHEGYDPQRDPLVAETFEGIDTFNVYDPAKDKDKEWLCGAPACSARMHFRNAVAYEGDPHDINRAHFATNPKSKHMFACVYEKSRAASDIMSLREAIATGAPILVNINKLPCGFSGTKPVDYEHWIAGKEPGTYHTHSVHSLEELVDFIDKVKAMPGGPAALANMWFNNNGMVKIYEGFDLRNQEEAGLVSNPAYAHVLRELLSRALMSDSNEICSATRLIKFTPARHDPKDPEKISGHAILLRRTLAGEDVTINQTLYVKNYAVYLENVRHDMLEYERASRALTGLKRPGTAFDVLATAVLVLPANPVARAQKLNAIKNMLDGQMLMAGKEADITIEWRLDKDFMKQIKARMPAPGSAPHSDFQTGLSFIAPGGSALETIYERAMASASVIASAPSITPAGNTDLFGRAVKPARAKSAAHAKRSDKKLSAPTGQPRLF